MNQSSGVIEDLQRVTTSPRSPTWLSPTAPKRSELSLSMSTPLKSTASSITIAFDRELASTRLPTQAPSGSPLMAKRSRSPTIKLKPDNREALLTLKSPVAFGDSVALSYTDAQGNQKSNVIEDLEGNDLATTLRTSPSPTTPVSPPVTSRLITPTLMVPPSTSISLTPSQAFNPQGITFPRHRQPAQATHRLSNNRTPMKGSSASTSDKRSAQSKTS